MFVSSGIHGEKVDVDGYQLHLIDSLGMPLGGVVL